MKLNKEEVKLFKETHDKWLKEGSVFARLFAKYVSNAVKNDRNIKSIVAKADKDLENRRKSIEKTLGGDKQTVKDTIPLNVRKALGFDY
jgi:thymidine kinase